MTFKKGMKFRGNKNNREIEILKVENGTVQYRDLKYNTVFCFDIKAFERCDITRIK